MSTKPAPLQEQAIIIVGGINDAPGFKLVSDGHGGYKRVPIPGWNPEQFAELAASLKVLASVGQIKQPDANKSIMTAAAKLANEGIAHLSGGQAGNTVIIVG
jgi:hypothetical protein